nr:hypothetical protein [Tanacetum cinerariifolium]
MLNKENYVPWSSHLLRYAKSRPNGKLIYNSIINGPYVRRMIPEPGDANREVEADDQAIQTILLGLPEDIYAAIEKKANLFNEWEMFTSTDGESIESYYHRFLKLMNDFKRNKHFPEKIAIDYTQLYDFLKYNQKKVDDLRAERLAKSHDPLVLMENSNNPFNFHQDQPSPTILSGADNRPPMLEKDMYDSWKSRMELYMMNRQHGRMIFEFVENGPLLWPTIDGNRVTRPNKYSELSASEAIQADCDVKSTNIILQGLSPEVYALVSNHKVAKELWERIQLLMQGTSLTKQEREYKLYDEFDKFACLFGTT